MTVTRTNPFIASIKERYRLNKMGSTKETWHFVLDLAGSGVHYRPGDSIGIFPENDLKKVEDILASIRCAPDTMVHDTRSGNTFSLKDSLLKKCNISSFSHKLVLLLSEKVQNSKKRSYKHFLGKTKGSCFLRWQRSMMYASYYGSILLYIFLLKNLSRRCNPCSLGFILLLLHSLT